MDFEYTSQRNIDPPWSNTRKRMCCISYSNISLVCSPLTGSFAETMPPAPPFPEPSPSFPFPQPQIAQAPQNMPFLFHTPPPSTHPPTYWQPPAPEVAMQDLASSSERDHSVESSSSSSRPVATGAITRVFKSRQKEKQRLQTRRRTPHIEEEVEEEPSSEDDHVDRPQKLVSNNHYTLHMPSPVLNHSDIPYLLLGFASYIYLLP